MSTILNYTITNAFALIVIAFILGIFTSLISVKTSECTKNMTLSLLFLPPLVCAALLAVNGNVGVSVAILGVFSLVRFRSVPGTSRDIVNVFFAMVAGLLVSTGYIFTAVGIVLILGVCIYLASTIIKLPEDKYELKIIVPETMNFEDVFDEILVKYFTNSELYKVKTANMGTLFELNYRVIPKKEINKKELIDEIRTHNGNLTVAYYKSEKDCQSL